MQSALRTTAKVRRGGKVEFIVPQLPVNTEVEVIILYPESTVLASLIAKRSVVDILAEAPGHQLFKTPEDVEGYLAEEHGAWNN
jgi:hypothetical protein